MSIIDGNLDSLKFEIQEESRHGARIKVVGVGGCGLNAVSRLVEEGLEGPEFFAIDTDAQALAACHVPFGGAKADLGILTRSRLAPSSQPDSAAAPAPERPRW